MPDHGVSRRDFIATAVVGVAGAVHAPSAMESPAPVSPAATASDTLKLGVASYSLREFPRAKAIEMIQALGTPYVNIKSVHLAYTLSPSEIASARREFEAAGLTIVGGGTITFERDTDDDVKQYFEYAKAAGMPIIVATAAPAILPRIERFATQYNISVAIHNHGPEDAHYPSPYDVLRYVKNMGPRMGLCIDIGHTVRTGTDVVKAIADAGPRVLDLHLKDLRDFKSVDSQVIVGQGKIPIAGIFRQLMAMNCAGYANLEYEIDAMDPLPGMKQSFAHMRGVLAGLAGRDAHLPSTRSR
jgi:sugar phosphate isomerase/epimerase